MKLYWYLKAAHAAEFFRTGKMYFGNCSRYEDSSLTAAQRDAESHRTANFTANEMIIRTGANATEAVKVPFSEVEFVSALPSYFLRSLSTQYRANMLAEMNADAVIEIFDVPALIAAVEDATSKQLNTGPWRIVRKEVSYVSKHELIHIHGPIEQMFTKDAAVYRKQAEFRLVLVPEHPFPGIKDSHLFLFLEDVSRFAKRFV